MLMQFNENTKRRSCLIVSLWDRDKLITLTEWWQKGNELDQNITFKWVIWSDSGSSWLHPPNDNNITDHMKHLPL
jgi:hypothetical protein